MENIQQQIEALIFSAETPLTIKDIQECLSIRFGLFIADTDLQQSLNALVEKYQTNNFAIEIKEISSGYQFFTKQHYYETVSVLMKEKNVKRLTTAAMETLAIVAYKQPISKGEIEQIRGVSVDYSIQKLLEKELIVPAGRSEALGKPVLYATSQQFMDYFGINSVNDLPKLKDIQPTDETSSAGIPTEQLN
jgi:segregation and condensation protein B